MFIKKILSFSIIIMFTSFFIPVNQISLDSNDEITSITNNQDVTLSNQTKIDNPNNHPIVDYPNGSNYVGIGSSIDVEIVEDEANGQQVLVSDAYVSIPLKSGYTDIDATAQITSSFFTLYDVTDNYRKIESKELFSSVDFSMGWSTFEDVTLMNWILSAPISFDASGLEQFHDYRVGFNIIEGDDMMVFSNAVELSAPELTTFKTSSTEDSITVDYEFVNPSSTVIFTYNELYILVGDKRVDLDATRALSDSITIDGLKEATEYEVVIGYDVTKTVSSTIEYNLSHEFNTIATTSMPTNYIGTELIAIGTILLIILLIILIILIFTILYWNYQRRKVSGLALASEDISQDNYNDYQDGDYYDDNGEYGIADNENYYDEDYYDDNSEIEEWR